MSSTGKSKDDERIRQIVRDVLSETHTTSVSERDMVNNMMQLLQQNVSKQTAELHAAAEEKEQYKAKLEELNHRMDQVMKDRSSQASGAEGSGLSAKQKRLVEMLEELKNMRETRRSEQGRPGKPFNRGGGRGGAHGDYNRREQQYQRSAAFNKFDRQNKDGTQFHQGKYSYDQNQGIAENFKTADHDSKAGRFQGKPFHQDNLQKGPMAFQKKFPQYGEREDFDPHSRRRFVGHGHGKYSFDQNEEKTQPLEAADNDFNSRDFQGKPFHQHNLQKGPMTFQKFPQYGERDGTEDFDPRSRSRVVGRDHGSQYGYRRDGSGPEFGHRAQNTTMQHHSFHRGSSQHREQYQKQPHGQFHQNRWQFQHHGQGQGSDPSSRPKELNQFTPEEIDAIKAVLKQQQQDQDKKPDSTPLVVNPNKKASKKKKKQGKKPEGSVDLKLGDNDGGKESDNEVGEHKSSSDGKVKSLAEDGEPPSAELGATTVDTTTDEKSVTDTNKTTKKKEKRSKDQAASPNKPEDLSPLEVFMASGFDVSEIADLNMNEKVNDIMLIAKEGGNIVPCQPNTVGELIEFKQKYPNAQAIIVKTSEQK